MVLSMALASFTFAGAAAKTPREARDIACRFGRTKSTVITARSDGADRFHAVNLERGGYAVVSGRDGKVLAFSDGGEFPVTNAAPIWAMLMKDTGGSSHGSSAVESRVMSSGLSYASSAVTSSSGLDEVRVAPLLATKWSQSTVSGKKVFNYCTPGNSVCGCVATAMAQIMKCHAFPSSPVSAKTKACTYAGSTTNLVMQGGTYDWDAMPDVPDSSISSAGQQALGKIASDAGISVHMNYTSDSSGAFNVMAAMAFTNTWGFAQSLYWCNTDNSGDASDGYAASGVIEDAILASLDAGCPCLLGVSDGSSGHAIVADGYGFLDGERYIHLNMGWSGACDYWYIFPVSAYGYTFSYLADAIYNIFPEETGNVVSGRVTSTNGVAVAGASVSFAGYRKSPSGRPGSSSRKAVSGSAVTSSAGIYAFTVPDGTVTITNLAVSMSGYSPSATNGVSAGSSKCLYILESDIESSPSSQSVSLYGNSQSVGNSWGNDIVLSAFYVAPLISSAPVFCSGDPSVSLLFEATAGTVWTLQWTGDLADDASWTDILEIAATGSALAVEIPSGVFDRASHASAFFRFVQTR